MCGSRLQTSEFHLNAFLFCFLMAWLQWPNRSVASDYFSALDGLACLLPFFGFECIFAFVGTGLCGSLVLVLLLTFSVNVNI